MGWFDSAWGSILGGLQTGASLYGSEQSLKAAKETNATNVMLARENRDWLQAMSASEVQRRMADIKSAGLNPLLAVTSGSGGASTPNVSAAQIDNPGAGAEGAVAGAVSNAASTILQSRQMMAATKVAEATARKTDAEASVLEAEVPFSAENARWKSEALRESFDKLAHEVHVLEQEERRRDFDITEYQPLVAQYQALINQAERLGMSEKAATSQFFERVPEGKWAQILKQLLFGSGSVLKR